MHLLKKVSLSEKFRLPAAGAIFALATMLIGTAPTAQAHEDHGTNVVIDISRTNNNRIVLHFDTQANKISSIQYVSSFVSTNVNGTNLVFGVWTTLITFPVLPPGSRVSHFDSATNISRIYRLKIF